MSTNGFAFGSGAPALAGEVVEASTTEFLAQAIELDSAPGRGTRVRITLERVLLREQVAV